jgi:hypothetical protein
VGVTVIGKKTRKKTSKISKIKSKHIVMEINLQ